MKLAIDIQRKIDSLFQKPDEKLEVEKLLLSLSSSDLNVGHSQLARAILVLSEGKLSEVKKIFDSKFYGDPRDLLMSAEAKAGNPGHYFNEPFPAEP